MDFLHTLATIRNPVLDGFFRVVTEFGAQYVLIVIALLIYWIYDEKLGYRLGTAVFLGMIVVNTVKVIAAVPRPWVLDPTFSPIASAVAGATGYSFPSGHTQAATSAFLTLFFSTRLKKRYACPVIIVLVGFSRMYLGVHTPADVLTGFLIGAASAIAAIYIEKAAERHHLRIHAATALLALAALILTLSLQSSRAAGEVADTFKTAGALLGFAIAGEWQYRRLHFQAIGYKNRKISAAAAIIGLLGLAVVYGLPKLLHVLPFIRYFLIPIYAMGVYPFLLQRKKERFQADRN